MKYGFYACNRSKTIHFNLPQFTNFLGILYSANESHKVGLGSSRLIKVINTAKY